MMDKVIGELKTIREEQIIIGHQITDNRERIATLEEIHPGGQHKTL